MIPEDTEIEALRYPVGPFEEDHQPTRAKHKSWIDRIAALPHEVCALVQNLTNAQLDTRYRPGGWTVRQVVHHLPDSHMNAYLRTKLALTEDGPTIKPYNQVAWAELPDGSAAPIEMSLGLLEALHARWVYLLRELDEPTLRRTLHHPEDGIMTISRIIQGYAWHGRHHLAHLSTLRDRMGWS